MLQMKSVRVECSSPYEVVICDGLLTEVVGAFPAGKEGSTAYVLTDENVAPLYLDSLETGLRRSFRDVKAVVIASGEEHKTLDTVGHILGELARLGATRSDTLFCLGGGVVTDTGGLAAALYMRGIDVVNVPTTILAAADAAVGGKNGVDLPTGKNLVGTFKQPKRVICDVSAFTTLDNMNISNGIAEIIKCGIIADQELFELLERNTSDTLDFADIITRSVKIKADFIRKDEFDNGERAKLNFGHTVGHAIEKLSGYKTPHGFAVAIGMALLCQNSRVTRLLQRYELPVATEFTSEQIVNAAMNDKKKDGDSINVIFPSENIGECRVKRVTFAKFQREVESGLVYVRDCKT
ncbi:MAG: 3-dehydroquinate synthase [Oscillospiraceae bacterium]|jgi:3-dehydroquinate synthase|nr:3-dehydroquinate synthase [Oscillospiraceae bacterium]